MTADDRQRIRLGRDEAARQRAAKTKGWRLCRRCHREQERTEFSPSSSYCKACETERAAAIRATYTTKDIRINHVCMSNAASPAPMEMIVARIPPELRAQLDRVAQLHDRSTSAELRMALRAHIALHQDDADAA